MIKLSYLTHNTVKMASASSRVVRYVLMPTLFLFWQDILNSLFFAKNITSLILEKEIVIEKKHDESTDRNSILAPTHYRKFVQHINGLYISTKSLISSTP